MGVFLIFFILIGAPVMSFLTIETKIVPTHDDCRHVTVTTWFGALKHVDQELCGDEKLDFKISINKRPLWQSGKPDTASQ